MSSLFNPSTTVSKLIRSLSSEWDCDCWNREQLVLDYAEKYHKCLEYPFDPEDMLKLVKGVEMLIEKANASGIGTRWSLYWARAHLTKYAKLTGHDFAEKSAEAEGLPSYKACEADDNLNASGGKKSGKKGKSGADDDLDSDPNPSTLGESSRAGEKNQAKADTEFNKFYEYITPLIHDQLFFDANAVETRLTRLVYLRLETANLQVENAEDDSELQAKISDILERNALEAIFRLLPHAFAHAYNRRPGVYTTRWEENARIFNKVIKTDIAHKVGLEEDAPMASNEVQLVRRLLVAAAAVEKIAFDKIVDLLKINMPVVTAQENKLGLTGKEVEDMIAFQAGVALLVTDLHLPERHTNPKNPPAPTIRKWTWL